MSQPSFGEFLMENSRAKNVLRHIKHFFIVKFKPRTNRVYTQFYRFPNQYQVIVEHIVPELRKKLANSKNNPSLNILIFACCSGEEAFSLAHVLQTHFPQLVFNIRAFDIVDEVVAKARAPVYTREQVYQGPFVTDEFVAQVFDENEDMYRVKAGITAPIEFAVGDMLDEKFMAGLGKADMVIAQNVLFHLPPNKARVAFKYLNNLMDEGSVLFVNGMDTDMRIKLTKRFDLEPIVDRIEEIHEDARVDRGNGWAGAYWGRAPFSKTSKEWVRKHCTIYRKQSNKK